MRAGRGIIDGGGCEKSGMWEYASLSGALNPMELVPMYVGLCIMLTHECVELKKNSSVLRHCVNHEPHVSLFSFRGVCCCWYILVLTSTQCQRSARSTGELEHW